MRSSECLAAIENPEEKSVLVYERRQVYADLMIGKLENLSINGTRVKNDEELQEKLKVKDYSFILVTYVLLKNVKKILSESGSKAQIVALINTPAMPAYSVQEKFNSGSGLNEIMKIEGVDVKKGINMAGGTFKNYLQILSVFYMDGIQKIEEIKRCLETDNYNLYIIYILALKSASAYICANQISETANILETAGRQGDFEFIKLHNAQFLATLQILLDNISVVILANSENKQEKAVDSNAIKNSLLKLKEALGTLDLDIIDKTVNDLREFTQVAEIEKILQNILIGNYDEAVSMINRAVKSEC